MQGVKLKFKFDNRAALLFFTLNYFSDLFSVVIPRLELES